MDITSDMVHQGVPDPSKPTIIRMIPVPAFGQLFLMSDDQAEFVSKEGNHYHVSKKNLGRLQFWIKWPIWWRLWDLVPIMATVEEGTIVDTMEGTWLPAMKLAIIIQEIIDENTKPGGQL